MSFVKGLRCRECGHEYPVAPTNVCELCFGPVEVVYEYEAISRVISREKITRGPLNMSRYKELLPVDGDIIDIGTGFTPLTRAKHLGKVLGLDNLYIKNDCLNPSYSFKDRVVSIAVSKAIEFGFDTLACASTGNLAGAVAAHAAEAGLQSYVFVPADLEPSKLIGASVYGPTLVAVDGDYDQVNRLCSELADRFNWAFVNINIRPFYAEGSKTLGFEVAEQLGWRAPDYAIVPVASGSLFTKVWKGWQELHSLGLIGPVRTGMYVAQAAGSSPVVNAYEAGKQEVRPVKPNTICKSLAIGNPADGRYVLKILAESGGGAVAVSDDDIVDGMKLLAQTEGIFAETAGGVVTAALRKLASKKVFPKDAVVVALITGAGYKTLEAVSGHLPPALHIQPTVTSFEEALQKRKAEGQSTA
ncbi:MAG: threonine synthase [Dehalococcoidia bacterium]|nr:threonine synthase [Dehalococcoidia bacterium]